MSPNFDSLDPSEKPSAQARIVNSIRNTPLPQLGLILRAISDTVAEYRAAHNGFVPAEVFPEILGITGQYACLEIIPRVVDSEGVVKGYLLKKRGEGEQGWVGEYHIPGVVITPRPERDSISAARLKLEREIDLISAEEWSTRRHQLRAIGVETHYEPERITEALTIVQALDISEAEYSILSGTLPGTWKFFSCPVTEGSGVVAQHVRTLAWANRVDRPNFDLRDL